MTRFSCLDRNQFVFCVEASNLTLKLDWRSKLIKFQWLVDLILILCGRIEFHQFDCMGGQIGVITVWGIKFDLISVYGSEMT